MKHSTKFLTCLSVLMFTTIFFSCKRELSCVGCADSNTGNNNKTPVALAGRDTVIALPLDSAVLDGSASYDPDGTIAGYSWSEISGPSSFLLVNSQSAVTKVKNLVQGIYRFELKVTDNKGLSTADTVMITANAAETTNHRPVAVAGTDQLIYLPVNTVTLDGSSSSDPDNNITSYQWTKISGPSSFYITNQNAVRTQASVLVEGIYQFELKVTDAVGLFSKDTLQVTVISQQSACNIDSRPVIQARLVPLGKLSIGRFGIAAAAANNKILFAGGSGFFKDSTGIPTRRIDLYDINTNSWSINDLVPFPPFRLEMGIAATENKILIAGGGFWGDDIYTNQVDIYNASNNNWATASLHEARTEVTGISAGNKVFFAGGFGLDVVGGYYYWSKMVDVYDNATNTWTTSTLSEDRGYVSAAAAGNMVYFAGGEKDDIPSNRIDEYDMTTNSWSTSTLQEARSGMAAIAVGNKIFFAGGARQFGESGTVEIRDVVSGTTSFACIIPRVGFTAVLKDDKIVFFTGSGSDPRNGTHFEIYNITTDTWYTGVLDKNITRAAVISVNNVIYVAGGYVNGVGSDDVWKLEF